MNDFKLSSSFRWQQQLQADIDRLQQQCRPQLLTVRYTKLPSTITRPRKPIRFI